MLKEASDTVNFLEGGDGNDFVSGGYRQDLIFGNKDNDYLTGDGGEDLIDGGEGDDHLYGDSAIVVQIQTGLDTTPVEGLTKTQNWSALPVYDNGTSSTYQKLAGTQAVKYAIENHKYNDTLVGGIGADKMVGEIGDDTLLGGSGDDYMEGDRSRSDVSGFSAENALLDIALHGEDYLDGGEGSDHLWGNGKADILKGGSVAYCNTVMRPSPTLCF